MKPRAQNSHGLRVRMVVATLSGLVLANAPSVRTAEAVCTYSQLTSGQMDVASYSPEYFTFNQNTNYWTVVGVRPFPGTDWDVRVYANSAADPTCVSGFLSSSVGGTSVLDFVVGDFNHNPQGTYYVGINQYAGNGIGLVEWDDGADQIPVNGSIITRYTHEYDPLEIWDVFLEAGTTYWFTFNYDAGIAGRIFVFGNPANAPYWAGRGSRLAESTSSFAFTPTASDWYGVVVTNENGYRGDFRLAVGRCTPPVALGPFDNVDVAHPNAYFSFNQNTNDWSAVGVRAAPGGADWDLQLFQNGSGSGPPSCFSGSLAASTALPPRVDFVIGDFNASPQGTYYVRPYLDSGSTGARVDWDTGSDQIIVNGPAVGRNVTGEVLEVWDVLLEAGQTYTIHFNRPPELDSKLLLFQNPGGVYFANRAQALFETSATTTFTAPVTQYYGLVVVHDGHTIGENFFVAVSTCPPFADLASASPITVASPADIYRFTQYANYWAAVGVRSQSDWNLQINQDPSGSSPPVCVGNTQAGSFAPGPGVDFVVGDFNHNLRTEYHVTFSRPSGNTHAVVEWDDGADILATDAAAVARSTGADDVLEVWDVYLEEGRTYYISFERDGPADTRFLLYRSFTGSFWGFPSTSVLQGTTPALYTAPATDWYGMVVVNDNGLAGTYQVGLYHAAVAVGPEVAPARSALQAVRPNPGSGPLTFQFELQQPGSVEFEVLDLAGRVVARVPPREWGAGSWTHSWDGRAESGRQLSAGIYFVRMKLQGETIGSRKVAIVG